MQVLPALRFDNVRLLVDRFDDTYAFYRDVLGLSVTWGEPDGDYASFVLPGGGQIALFRRSLMPEEIGEAPGTRAAGDAMALVLSTESVDAACEALRARGVTFASPPVSREAWGIRAAHLRDPDGNLVEIFSPLPK